MKVTPSRRTSFAAGTKSLSPETRMMTSALILERYRGDVKSYSHINPLLSEVRREIGVFEVRNRQFAVQETFLRNLLQDPRPLARLSHLP